MNATHTNMARLPLLAVGCLGTALSQPGLAGEAPRPNIVLINCDDLDFDESELSDFYDYRTYPSFTGAKKLGYTYNWQSGLDYNLPQLTPNIRTLAEEGCVFNRFYMTSSLCTPSRYSLMTGQYASRSPLLEKEFGKTDPAGFQMQGELAPKQWIFPKALQQAGYATGLVGKWHLIEWGSEERGYLIPGIPDADVHDPEVAARIAKVYQQGCDYIKRNYGFDYVGGVYQSNANGLGLPKELVRIEHNMEWQTYHAMSFIDQNHDKPFFLYFAPTVPHGWYDADTVLKGDIEATPEGYTSKHVGAQPSRQDVLRRIKKKNIDPRNIEGTWLDDGVGAVLKKLDEYGLRDNTIVIFTSDQQSRGKFTCYEGCHVPFVVRWPAKIPAGSRCDQLTANIDMAATLLNLAEAKIPDGVVTDGLDMSPLFLGQTDWRLDRDLLLEIGYMRAVVSGDWQYNAFRLPTGKEPMRDPASWKQARELMTSKGGQPPAVDAPLTPEELQCVSYDGRIYYFLTGKPWISQGPDRTFPNYSDKDQLYNLKSDPYQQKNLYGNPEDAPKLKEMQQRLSAEMSGMPRHFGEFN